MLQLRASPITLRAGSVFESTSDEDFGVTNILRLRAKDDLYGCMDLAKSFKKDRPRAAAILDVSRATPERASSVATERKEPG